MSGILRELTVNFMESDRCLAPYLDKAGLIRRIWSRIVQFAAPYLGEINQYKVKICLSLAIISSVQAGTP